MNQIDQFLIYSAAVSAERYRVTSIRMLPDGGKRTFILDKKNGITQGFTPLVIEQRIPEMLRLQSRGENLYYTPLSNARHHILIDDMSRDKLDRLICDGYKPAVVIESSPGNYQAVITIQKLGTQHDKNVGNRVTERLNRQYGDRHLSGCIHPHRAPGFQNRKQKHQLPDGTFPEVRLLKAERRECVKTLALSRQIDAVYQQLAVQKVRQPQPERYSISSPEWVSHKFLSLPTLTVYEIHRADILSRHHGPVDWSRVDHMIAVRMSVCGHSPAEIEATILACAHAARPPEKSESHNWPDYARRTAHAASSHSQKYAGYARHWASLEKRAAGRGVSTLQPIKSSIRID